MCIRDSSYVFLHELGTDDTYERRISAVCNCPCKKSFSSAWRAKKQNALWWLDTNLFKELWLCQWKFYNFPYIPYLVVETTDISIRDICIRFNLKCSHIGVICLRDNINNRKCMHIQCDLCPCFHC